MHLAGADAANQEGLTSMVGRSTSLTDLARTDEWPAVTCGMTRMRWGHVGCKKGRLNPSCREAA